MKYISIALFLALNQILAVAQEDESTTLELDSVDLQELISYYEQAHLKDSLLQYERGLIELSSGLATLDLEQNFKYLDPEQTNQLLQDWGNPPQESLGMIVPDSLNPYLWEGWAVVIDYVEDGYIKDEDAQEIDYDELLSSLQDDAIEDSKNRRAAGYGGYNVVGWAESPYYDEDAKKLYWAKELAFDGTESSTLNYDIRVLGRRGYLQLNAVANTEQLASVKVSMQDLLARVEFNEGHTYFDFDPSVDQVAAYGLGALVAGKLAAKAGILKVVGVFLAKFWKVLLIAGGGLIAAIRRFWLGPETREA